MMITNFEEITKDLTADERRLAWRMLEIIISKASSTVPIKAHRIKFLLDIDNIDSTGPRIRKACNYLRCRGVPLIATSKGYFYTNDQALILKQIKSLHERALAIEGAASGLINCLDDPGEVDALPF